MATMRRLEILISADGSIAVREIGNVGGALDDTTAKAEEGGSAFGGWAAAIVAAAAVAGAAILKVGQALGEVADKYTDAFNTISNTTGATGQTFDNLKQDLSGIMGNTTAEVGDAATALSRIYQVFGQTGDGAVSLSQQMLSLARVTGTDVGEAVESSAALWRAWQVSASDAASVNDRLFRASQITGTSITEINGILAENAPLLRSFGLSLDQSTNLMVNLNSIGVDFGQTLDGLEELSGNFAQAHQQAMQEAEQAEQQLAAASKNLQRAQQNLYDLEERLAVQRSLTLEDNIALRNAQQGVAEAQIRANRMNQDAADKLADTQQNLIDLQERLASKGQLDVGDMQAMRKAQEAIADAQVDGADRVRKAEKALIDLRARQKGHRPDVADRQAIAKAEEAITEAKQDQAKKIADANQSLLDLQERLGHRTDLTVQDQQALRKATEAISDAQQDQAETASDAQDQIQKAQQNLLDTQAKLEEKTKLSISDQQQLRNAHRAVADAQGAQSAAAAKLSEAQAKLNAIPKNALQYWVDSIEAIQNADSEAEKFSIAQQRFGEEGAARAIDLADRLDKAGLKARDLLKDPAALKNFENGIKNADEKTRKWTDQLTVLKNKIEAVLGPKLANFIGNYLTPALKEMNQWLGDHLPGAVDYLRSKWDEVFPKLKELWDRFGPVVLEVITKIRDILWDLGERFANLFKTLSENQETMDNFKTGLAVIATVIGGSILGGIIALGIAIGVVITVIGAIVLAIGTFITALGEAWNWANRVWDGIANAAGSAWNWISTQASNGVNWIVDKFAWLWDRISAIASGVGKAFNWAWEAIVNGAGWVWGNLTRGFNWLIDTVWKLPGKVWDALNGLWDIVWKGFKSAINYVIEIWNGFARDFKVDVGPVHIGGLPTIPKFHQGGVFETTITGGEGLALLRDGERVLTPSQSASYASMAPADSGGNVEFHLHVEGAVVYDERALMKTVATGLAEFKRTGGRGPWSN